MGKPSHEVKKLMKLWCEKQRENHGEDWKEIKAEEIAQKTTEAVMPLLNKLKDTNNDE